MSLCYILLLLPGALHKFSELIPLSKKRIRMEIMRMERKERKMKNMRMETMKMEKTRMEMAENRERGLERTKMEWNIVLNSPTNLQRTQLFEARIQVVNDAVPSPGQRATTNKKNCQDNI